MAISLSTALAVSTAVSVVGALAGATTAIVGGVQSYQSNKAQQKNAEAMAQQERANAERARQAANEEARGIEMQQAAEERTQRRKNAALLARNRARIGASGIAYSGSTLLNEIDNAMNMELDIQNQRIDALNQMQNKRYQGHLLSVQSENKATSYDFTANQYKNNNKWVWAETSGNVLSSTLKAAGSVAGNLYVSNAFSSGGGNFYNTNTGYSVTNKPSLLVG